MHRKYNVFAWFAKLMGVRAVPAAEEPATRPAGGTTREPSPPSPLAIAIGTHQPDEALRLIDAGADVNADGGLPLREACVRREWDVVQSLIRHGADVNSRDGVGNGPLHNAAVMARDEAGLAVIKALLAKGADVNSRGIGGFTPLHSACEGGRVEAARLLLDHGADVHATDRTLSTRTPLHVVCDRLDVDPEVSLELLTLLVERGAEVNIRDRDGITPLDRIMMNLVPADPVRRIQEQAIEFLRAHGAKRGAELPPLGAGGQTATPPQPK